FRRCVRHAVDPAHLPDRPPDDPLHAAGLHRRRADVAGRPRVRDEPDRPARHLPDVLHPGRVRLPDHRPGRVPGPAGRGHGRPGHQWARARPGDPLGAGFSLGCACASKQFGAWYILGSAALAIAWDVGARRAAGLDRFWRSALLREAKWLPISFGLVPLAVYLASWSGWFASSFGWDRHYAASRGVHTPVLSGLYSLYEYHVQML